MVLLHFPRLARFSLSYLELLLYWEWGDASKMKKSQYRFFKEGDSKMVVYEFYRRDPLGEEDRLIGVLPERRKDPKRITHQAIMNWGKLLAPEDFLREQIYFVRVESK
jgi:hypothetical protein